MIDELLAGIGPASPDSHGTSLGRTGDAGYRNSGEAWQTAIVMSAAVIIIGGRVGTA